MAEHVETPKESTERQKGTVQSSRGEIAGAPAPKETKERPSAAETEQLIITRGAQTGEILKIERIDASGVRADFSDEESLKIAGEDEIDEIDAALDAAFDAGIAAMLAGDGVEELRRNLLRRLLLRRLIRRHVLQNRQERTTR